MAKSHGLPQSTHDHSAPNNAFRQRLALATRMRSMGEH